MSSIKEKWKKLKRWQKLGIVFGVVHIVLLSLTLLIMFSDSCHECALLIFVPEFIPFLIHSAIYDLSRSNIDLWHLFENLFVETYIFGTIIYSLLGISIGYLVDKRIERRKKLWLLGN